MVYKKSHKFNDPPNERFLFASTIHFVCFFFRSYIFSCKAIFDRVFVLFSALVKICHVFAVVLVAEITMKRRLCKGLIIPKKILRRGTVEMSIGNIEYLKESMVLASDEYGGVGRRADVICFKDKFGFSKIFEGASLICLLPPHLHPFTVEVCPTNLDLLQAPEDFFCI